MLSYGNDGFWNSLNGAMLSFNPCYFTLDHVHNSLLQTILALGAVVGAILIAAYFILLRRKIGLTNNNADQQADFDLTYVDPFLPCQHDRAIGYEVS